MRTAALLEDDSLRGDHLLAASLTDPLKDGLRAEWLLSRSTATRAGLGAGEWLPVADLPPAWAGAPAGWSHVQPVGLAEAAGLTCEREPVDASTVDRLRGWLAGATCDRVDIRGTYVVAVLRRVRRVGGSRAAAAARGQTRARKRRARRLARLLTGRVVRAASVRGALHGLLLEFDAGLSRSRCSPIPARARTGSSPAARTP